MSQLRDLARKFPESVIQKNPSGGGSYVPHHLYVQRLLMHLGGYDFERVEIIRGHVAGKPVPTRTARRHGRRPVPPTSTALSSVSCAA